MDTSRRFGQSLSFRPFFGGVILLTIVLTGLSCSDVVAPRDDDGLGSLPFHADVAAPGVSTLVVEVTASDIPADIPLVFNFELGADGIAQGTIEIPAGADRTITVRAFDADGTQTHQGETTVDVVPGPNQTVVITLAPLPGGVPITVVLGEFDIRISEAPTIDLQVEPTAQLTAEVVGLDANGSVIGVLDVEPRWATDAPTIASVDQTGLVTGASGGVAEIVGTYAGVGESVFVTVLGDAALRNKIAFVSDRDGNEEIYVMNADGTGQTNLSQNDALDNDPRLSPDGTKIAFVSNRDGNFNSEIYVMNVDGTGQTNLSQNDAPVDASPRWSPDGTKIAFVSNRLDGTNLDIHVMNPDGTGQTNLSQNVSALDGDPRWSPDGTKIAFVRDTDGDLDGDEIFVMNADGTGQTNLSQNEAADFDARWSPDGTKIAFVTHRDDNPEIYVMNPDGTEQTNLSQNDALVDASPRWSPDGTKIAFESNSFTDLADLDIHVMKADGTGRTNLSQNPGFDVVPRWSPDGTKIAFESFRDGNKEIYVMKSADGTGQTNLSQNPASDLRPVWTPQ